MFFAVQNYTQVINTVIFCWSSNPFSVKPNIHLFIGWRESQHNKVKMIITSQAYIHKSSLKVQVQTLRIRLPAFCPNLHEGVLKSLG